MGGSQRTMTIETTRIHGFMSQLEKFTEFLEDLDGYGSDPFNVYFEAAIECDNLQAALEEVLEDIKYG